MTRQAIFLSSVQKEFAAERLALRDFLQGDPLLRRFFEPVLFEDLPASDRRADELYLDQVDRCCLYVGLFGAEYGNTDVEGISPTEREFHRAEERGKPRLIFLKAADDASRDPRMLALIRQAEASLVRRRFATTTEKAPRVPRRPRERILALMQEQPTITARELAQALPLSNDGVSYHLKKLRAEGRIRHEGPTKAGRWVVYPPTQQETP